MIVSTTPTLDGRRITRCVGIASGEAIVGVDLDHETLGQGSSTLMVCASGTAVVIE